MLLCAPHRLLSQWILSLQAAQDIGLHTVCAKMTREFLEFSVAKGNDLVTPLPEVGFQACSRTITGVCVRYVGLKRWMQIVAPPLKLEACHESLLDLVDLDTLHQYSI